MDRWSLISGFLRMGGMAGLCSYTVNVECFCHGPTKPTFLEAFMVHTLVLSGQNLYFSCFRGPMAYMYLDIECGI